MKYFLLFIVVVASITIGYNCGYNQGRYGDQEWQMKNTTKNTAVIIAVDPTIKYEWKFTSASGGIFKIFQKEEDADKCIEELIIFLQKH